MPVAKEIFGPLVNLYAPLALKQSVKARGKYLTEHRAQIKTLIDTILS
jgi:hypothetical protein